MSFVASIHQVYDGYMTVDRISKFSCHPITSMQLRTWLFTFLLQQYVFMARSKYPGQQNCVITSVFPVVAYIMCLIRTAFMFIANLYKEFISRECWPWCRVRIVRIKILQRKLWYVCVIPKDIKLCVLFSCSSFQGLDSPLEKRVFTSLANTWCNNVQL